MDARRVEGPQQLGRAASSLSDSAIDGTRRALVLQSLAIQIDLEASLHGHGVGLTLAMSLCGDFATAVKNVHQSIVRRAAPTSMLGCLMRSLPPRVSQVQVQAPSPRLRPRCLSAALALLVAHQAARLPPALSQRNQLLRPRHRHRQDVPG